MVREAADGAPTRLSGAREGGPGEHWESREATEDEAVAVTPVQLVDGNGEPQLREPVQQ